MSIPIILIAFFVWKGKVMKPIEMNQSLLSIKEKFYGFEIRQIVDAVLAGGASLAVNFLLPSELGVVRGIIASIVAVPFIIVAIKDLRGLSSWLQLSSHQQTENL